MRGRQRALPLNLPFLEMSTWRTIAVHFLVSRTEQLINSETKTLDKRYSLALIAGAGCGEVPQEDLALCSRHEHEAPRHETHKPRLPTASVEQD